METKKIAIACFVGAAIGTAVALSVAPMFWWLGMLAGFGAGYLYYDLKEIWEKAPIAWRIAKKGNGCALTWLVKPHPLMWLFLTILIALFNVFLFLFMSFLENPIRESFKSILFFSVAFSLLLGLLTTLVLQVIAEKAALARKYFWKGISKRGSYLSQTEREILLQKNYRQISITYKNIYGLMLLGLIDGLIATAKRIRISVSVLLLFLFWDMWVLVPKFILILIKLIYSHKRILCGIDSAIGVAITYFWLGSKTVTPGQQVMVIICGGIIGTVIGVLNYEIISKRLLHLAPAKNDV